MLDLVEIPIEFIGNIQVAVYKTNEGYRLFQTKADNQDILPIMDIIEDTLTIY